jgi:hypothetical protein
MLQNVEQILLEACGKKMKETVAFLLAKQVFGKRKLMEALSTRFRVTVVGFDEDSITNVIWSFIEIPDVHINVSNFLVSIFSKQTKKTFFFVKV